MMQRESRDILGILKLAKQNEAQKPSLKQPKVDFPEETEDHGWLCPVAI